METIVFVTEDSAKLSSLYARHRARCRFRAARSALELVETLLGERCHRVLVVDDPPGGASMAEIAELVALASSSPTRVAQVRAVDLLRLPAPRRRLVVLAAALAIGCAAGDEPASPPEPPTVARDAGGDDGSEDAEPTPPSSACAPLDEASFRASLVVPDACGSISTTHPGDAPSGTRKVASSLKRALPTSQWWSSLAWDHGGSNPWSHGLYPHPIAARARREGLGVHYVASPSISADGRVYTFELQPENQDLVVSIDGLDAPRTEVESFSDFAVTARWSSAGRTLRATLGKGMPFAWFDVEGGDAIVRFSGEIAAREGHVASVNVGGRRYGLFAPRGTTWSTTSAGLRAPAKWIAVAPLPDATKETLALFAAHAPLFPKSTRVAFCYDEARAAVDVDYQVEVEPREPAAAAPLLALYPHQWKHAKITPLPFTYRSARGPMKVVEASAFRASFPFRGVLPSLPDVGALASGPERAKLERLLRETTVPPGELVSNSYFGGKSLAKLANLLPIQDQLATTDLRARTLGELEKALSDWFDGKTAPLFRRFGAWSTLVGYPAAFHSDTMLNDHHFHWGYFVWAAALAELHDPGFAKKHAAIVKAMIRDAANPMRDDPDYPFMRSYDLYEGHGWASGHGNFWAGNNQESSSESMNFSAALVLYGAVTHDRAVRDLGAFLYAMEASAIEQYWFDADRDVFPSGFSHHQVGMIWGGSAAHATWFSPKPEHVFGINYLPLTSASFYLVAHPTMLRDAFAEMTKGGPPREWRDLLAMTQALFDADAARASFDPDAVKPEEGETRPHAFHFVQSLAGLGRFVPDVSGDAPTSAVFARDGKKAYVAFEPRCVARKVRFSDGTTFEVPPRTLVTFREGRVERSTSIGSCAPERTSCE